MKRLSLFGILLLSVFVFAGSSDYGYYVPVDEQGIIKVQAAPSFAFTSCRDDVTDGDYALELYGRTVFAGIDVDADELLSKCSEENGVDQIVSIIGDLTTDYSDADLRGACLELEDAVGRCEASKETCGEFKDKDREYCPPDEEKLVRLCMQQYEAPTDNCEEEYAKNRDKIAAYCEGDYKDRFVSRDYKDKYRKKELGENEKNKAQQFCADSGGNWKGDYCEFAENKPIYQRGECPPFDEKIREYCRDGQIVERTFDQGGQQCRYLSCEYAYRPPDTYACPALSIPPCSSGQYSQPVYEDSARPQCPSSYVCESYEQPRVTPPIEPGTQACPLVTMPTCPAGQYAQAQSGQGTACPSNYQCVSSTTQQQACPSVTMPTCSAGRSAQPIYSDSTRPNCPSRYECTTMTTKPTTATSACNPAPVCSSDRISTVVNNVNGCPVYSCEPSACSQPQVCSDGSRAVQGGGIQYVGGQACFIYTCTGTSTTTTAATGSGAAGACNAPIPTCPAGQYAQAQSGQATSCPSNYQCVTSPSSGSGGGSGTTSGATCPSPHSCGDGSTAVGTGSTDAQGCTVYTCPASTSSGSGSTSGSGTTSSGSSGSNQTAAGSRISGFAVASSQLDYVCPAVVSDPEREERARQECLANGGKAYADRCGFTACDFSGGKTEKGGGDFSVCTKEGFLKSCRSSIVEHQAGFDDTYLAEKCKREVKYNLPEMRKYCAEGNLFGKCTSEASKSCGCLKSKLAHCESLANRAKFLEVVREKAAFECKKHLLKQKGGEIDESVATFDQLKEGLPVEDRVLAESASRKIVLSEEDLQKLKDEIRADVVRDILTLLGLNAGQLQEVAEKQKAEVQQLREARASMQEICEKSSEDVKEKCDAELARLDKRIAEIETEAQGLEARAGGVLGIIANLLSGK